MAWDRSDLGEVKWSEVRWGEARPSKSTPYISFLHTLSYSPFKPFPIIPLSHHKHNNFMMVTGSWRSKCSCDPPQSGVKGTYCPDCKSKFREARILIEGRSWVYFRGWDSDWHNASTASESLGNPDLSNRKPAQTTSLTPKKQTPQEATAAKKVIKMQKKKHQTTKAIAEG